jgi:hypothetical protein
MSTTIQIPTVIRNFLKRKVVEELEKGRKVTLYLVLHEALLKAYGSEYKKYFKENKGELK